MQGTIANCKSQQDIKVTTQACSSEGHPSSRQGAGGRVGMGSGTGTRTGLKDVTWTRLIHTKQAYKPVEQIEPHRTSTPYDICCCAHGYLLSASG